ncbi:MAG: hypothetical protein QOJ59_4105 [Thermomicrobiales bacterium]|jgi:hypothetical protein|nr:hypothetical protein [Thermomicrobiales bacterium]
MPSTGLHVLAVVVALGLGFGIVGGLHDPARPGSPFAPLDARPTSFTAPGFVVSEMMPVYTDA